MNLRLYPQIEQNVIVQNQAIVAQTSKEGKTKSLVARKRCGTYLCSRPPHVLAEVANSVQLRRRRSLKLPFQEARLPGRLGMP